MPNKTYKLSLTKNEILALECAIESANSCGHYGENFNTLFLKVANLLCLIEEEITLNLNKE